MAFYEDEWPPRVTEDELPSRYSEWIEEHMLDHDLNRAHDPYPYRNPDTGEKLEPPERSWTDLHHGPQRSQ